MARYEVVDTSGFEDVLKHFQKSKQKEEITAAINAPVMEPHYHGHLHPTMVQEKVQENSMGDIAGLLALMQGNKGMDPAALLALCKDKGYDRSFGSEFMFLFFFLLLFANGGWNGLSRNNQETAQQMATANGFDCQRIIGLHDRISAAQAASTQGFSQMETNLCSSIAEVLAAVRNQGDRSYDATRNVGDAVRDCCCKLESQLSTITCELNGLGRDIREATGAINAKIELEALKAENQRAAMECRLMQQQKDCCCETQAAIADLKATIETQRLLDENARLARENSAMKDQIRGDAIAAAAVDSIKKFALDHYTVTRTAAANTPA